MGSLNEEQVHTLFREERNMRHTLEKERHRLLMRERELMAQVGLTGQIYVAWIESPKQPAPQWVHSMKNKYMLS